MLLELEFDMPTNNDTFSENDIQQVSSLSDGLIYQATVVCAAHGRVTAIKTDTEMEIF